MIVLQALHVCIALLDRQHPEPAPGQSLRQSVERAAAAAAELDSQLEADTVEGVCQHAHRLAALLDVAPDTAELVSLLQTEGMQYSWWQLHIMHSRGFDKEGCCSVWRPLDCFCTNYSESPYKRIICRAYSVIVLSLTHMASYQNLAGLTRPSAVKCSSRLI